MAEPTFRRGTRRPLGPTAEEIDAYWLVAAVFDPESRSRRTHTRPRRRLSTQVVVDVTSYVDFERPTRA